MLDDFFAPLSFAEFLKDYWPLRFLHLTGPEEKFAQLFPWSVLSKALEQHRFNDSRLRLVRSTHPIPRQRYLSHKMIDAEKLTAELSDGATLIFNNVEEVHAPLLNLCTALERVFHHRVYTNLYAGWRSDNGFDVHWDTQNNLIVQVSGRKRWKVWKPTRPFPFREELEGAGAPVDEEPFWDGILEQGCFLFIPRGWWHIAYPMDEPCLHLTVTLQPPTGIDLLKWLTERLKSSEAVRSDVPMVGPEESRREWLARVRADLLKAFDDDTISRFVADQDARIPKRPRISLPNDVQRRPVTIGKSTALRLAQPELLKFTRDGGSLICMCGGISFTTDLATGERLRRFNDRMPHSLEELSSGSDLSLKAVLGAMVLRGVLKRAEDSDD